MEFVKGKKETDSQKILRLMKEASEGKYTFCEKKDFRDKKLAEQYNRFLTELIEVDNKTLIDLNKSMDVIGNCNNMRAMLEIVNQQREALNAVVSAEDELAGSIRESTDTIDYINNCATEVYNSSVSSREDMTETIKAVNGSFDSIMEANNAMQGFAEKFKSINRIMHTIEQVADRTQLLSMNARVEASRAGEAGKGFAVVAEEISRLSADTKNMVVQIDDFIEELLNGMKELTGQMDELKSVLEVSNTSATRTEKAVMDMSSSMQDMIEKIKQLYDSINTQNTATTAFAQSALEIAKQSDMLEDYCKKPGKDMYIISRTIDKIRTALVKKRSKLSTNAMIDVYITDHLIFTGRLYNMVEGFEELLLRNLNQPNNCKYGKWSIGMRTAYPKIARDFANADKLHTQLHELATACFMANAAGEKKEAFECFDKAQKVYKLFAAELVNLKGICEKNGL